VDHSSRLFPGLALVSRFLALRGQPASQSANSYLVALHSVTNFIQLLCRAVKINLHHFSNRNVLIMNL